MHSAVDLVNCLGDFNGHVGMYVDGVRGWCGVCHKNLKGRTSLEFYLEKELCVSNT